LAEPGGSRGYANLRANALEARVSGATVKVSGLDDRLAMKKAAGRPKDLVAFEELEAIRRLRR
jgi:hypothetical protein